MTFEFGFAFLLAYFFLLYVFFLLKVLSGLAIPANSPMHSQANEFVSVIIAVRNEEATVGPCLESLLTQEYPANRYEIIVVDDGSSDNTRAVISRFRESDSRIRIVVPSGETSAGNKRKALAAGIREAGGDVLLFTDGDCTVTPGWIAGMARALHDPIRFVAGPVIEAGGDRLLQRLSRIEFLGLIGVAAGLIRAGNPIFCNGANIGYRKAAFYEIGGFGSDVHFSDDEVILQRFHAWDHASVSFLLNPAAVVSTQSPDSLRSFWQQRVRWSAKGGVYEDKTILIRLVVLYLFFFFSLCGMVLSIAFPALATTVLGPVLVGKFLLDWLVLRKSARILNQSFSLRHLFIAEILHVPYIVFAALQGQIGSLRWKGASVRK